MQKVGGEETRGGVTSGWCENDKMGQRSNGPP